MTGSDSSSSAAKSICARWSFSTRATQARMDIPSLHPSRSGTRRARRYSYPATTSGYGGPAQADRRQGHLRLYPWRDASNPRLPAAEEISAFLRTFRDRLDESAKRISELSRLDSHDYELHPETGPGICGQYFHERLRGLAGGNPHREP